MHGKYIPVYRENNTEKWGVFSLDMHMWSDFLDFIV